MFTKRGMHTLCLALPLFVAEALDNKLEAF